MTRLKTVFQQGFPRFNEIGGDFEILDKKESPQEFEHHFKCLFPNPEINDTESVYAILKTQEALIPLYEIHRYYIMNSDGSTFLNLSFKDGERKTFFKKHLIKFGNYLLSKERKNYFSTHPELGTENLEERLSIVHDSDFENWLYSGRKN